MDSSDGSYLHDPMQKESTPADLADLKSAWDIHNTNRNRKQNSGFSQVDDDERICHRNRAVYRQEEMTVEQRGLSVSSLHTAAVEIVVADAFAKSQVGSGSHM